MVRPIRAGLPAVLALLAACGDAAVAPAPPEEVPAPVPVLVGAGDIADCESGDDERTAALLDTIPGTVVTLGDNAYPEGREEDFRDCYAPSWGRHRERTRPSPGNHDYETRGAAGYFAYFGSLAGEPGRGYYSYDLGAWHVVSLNSESSLAPGSAQLRWLRDDLARHPTRCALAYMHRPLFSSGPHGGDPDVRPLWEALHAAGVDVVLAGHDHLYERFAPQTPAGAADPAGIRQFVAGTGGKRLYSVAAVQPNSEVRWTRSHGVLRLALEPDRYAWSFVPVSGSFRDAGTSPCH